jgi:hypothetical protein
MGIQKDLELRGNDFNWGATAFFVGYGVSELLQGMDMCDRGYHHH